ncbi:peptidase C39 family protein [Shumkonia mesophila]|uniref:peptidase C39 family protein n=1 Tax=Shumkonia mesophila TaxID=2838854 RepID=UPI0029346515|nr:peptidase C39 family protein [Shumkonia mesophila]
MSKSALSSPLRRPSDAGALPAAIRPAILSDLPDLVRIEYAAFASDRFSRRTLHYLLTRARAIFLVAEQAGKAVGNVVVLLHGRTSLARVYSMAVDPARQGAGVGLALLREAESRALADGRAVMRLEVRTDNARAIGLYRREGYREIGRILRYYEDGCDALRMEKTLAGGDQPGLSRVPYYAQTLEFTCGSAALMMAMKALNPTFPLSRNLELRLWRESTTVFMAAGHGGCGPVGLGLAAMRRGFDVEVHLSRSGPLFIDSVRSAEKRDVIRLVYEDFRREAAEVGLKMINQPPTRRRLLRFLDAGAVPVVLISSYRLYGEKVPHWVVLTGHDEHFVYLHDPYVDFGEHGTETDAVNVPVAHAEFDRMARYGNTGLRAAVIIRQKKETG